MLKPKKNYGDCLLCDGKRVELASKDALDRVDSRLSADVLDFSRSRLSVYAYLLLVRPPGDSAFRDYPGDRTRCTEDLEMSSLASRRV
jgi:hypothetical protein